MDKDKYSEAKRNEAGKGDSPRPRFVSDEEYQLRWMLAYGVIDRKEFNKKLKEIKNE